MIEKEIQEIQGNIKKKLEEDVDKMLYFTKWYNGSKGILYCFKSHFNIGKFFFNSPVILSFVSVKIKSCLQKF